ncbi:hypothetical protein TWF718_007583 [Orbilia javanica]|uniref:Uncharacterized protein n=1 Tax=Orbilia javanica TaxID=47235 RepID=A0AAN8N341_9PEZI
MSTIAFTQNTIRVQLDQTIGSVNFTGVTLANASNHAGVTSPPFAFVVVTTNAGEPSNYLIQPGATQPKSFKTYTISGPSGSGVISITDPDGNTAATFKQ